MSSSRLVRGAKTRMFAIVCLICVLGAVVFVFHGTQTKLAEVQKLVNSCNQQQESLSAQLQVIFEYKVRLEKSLTKEKEEHKQTKEALEGKVREEKLEREKDKQEAQRKHDALLQQTKFLQNQLDELKENEKKEVTKLSEDYKQIQKELDQVRKENEELLQQKDHELEDLKAEYFKKKNIIKDLEKELEVLKISLGPENVQKNYLEKENQQIKDEMEKMKKVLNQCEESKRAVDQPKPEAPNTNVGEMPKLDNFGVKSTKGSTTPGLNPDAVNNYEISSPKPLKELESPVVKKPSDQMSLPNKKSTQESVMPLPLPQQQAGLDQIPVPGGRHEPQGKDHDPSGNTLQKPNTGNAGQPEDSGPAFPGQGGGEPDVEQPKLFGPAPEDEDNFQKQAELPRVKNDNYPHGDYEREQPEDEEDDEGEQLDYDERAKKEQKNALQQPIKNPMVPIREPGIMVNPKK